MARGGSDLFVGVHVNATSLLDEGVERVLNRCRTEAGANAVMLAAHGFNPEVIDRPVRSVDHGGSEPHRSAGGFFATPHPEYYKDLPLGDFRVREGMFHSFDALEATLPIAHAQGLSVYVYILESAGTGGRQLNVSGFPRLLEIDVLGRRAGLPCINNPWYRSWKLALVEDISKSYDVDGFLWGMERWGPLHQAMVGEIPACFCEHCESIAQQRGVDFDRVRKGYRELWQGLRRLSSEETRRSSPVEVLRVFLAHPESIAWEHIWTERYLALHKELYGVAKWISPHRPFGLGLWHYYFINPLLQAEWNVTELAASADFIRPILYHLPEGPRAQRFVDAVVQGPFRGLSAGELFAWFCTALGLQVPGLEEVRTTGFPADYVAQGVGIVRREVGIKVPIYAGIGVDVVQDGLARAMEPDDVIRAVQAAVRAGADGITVSRNYAEMRLQNLRAVGFALRELKGRA